MKFITGIILVAVTVYVLTGSNIPNQLNEIAVVQAIGIDMSEDEFEITFQIYAPSSGKGEIDLSKDNASIITASGKTISQAINNATTLQGKELFIGHNRIIIISEDVAMSGIESIFSYFNTNDDTRDNAQVLMVQGKAKDIVSLNIKQGILPAETIEKTAKNSEENGYIFASTYYLLAQNMYLYDGSSVMPIIELIQSEDESASNQSDASSSGESSSDEINDIAKLKTQTTALFKDYKFIGALDKDDSRGLSFLSDNLDSTVLVVEDGEYIVSLNLYASKSISNINMEDTPTFEVNISASTSISEIIKPTGEQFDEEHIVQIEKAAEEIIKKECETAFTHVINEHKADVLYISNLLLKADKDEYIAYEGNFDDFMAKLNIDVNVNVEIDKLGLQIP